MYFFVPAFNLNVIMQKSVNVSTERLKCPMLQQMQDSTFHYTLHEHVVTNNTQNY